jgi:DNA-binding NtrC family response regulator
VSVAAGGREALDRIAAGPVDLVLTDMRMPGMDGLELLRQIRARAPALDVVLMTAFDDAGVAVTAAREGARAYLAKPLDLPDLRALVARLLREREDRCRPAGPSHRGPGSVP